MQTLSSFGSNRREITDSLFVNTHVTRIFSLSFCAHLESKSLNMQVHKCEKYFEQIFVDGNETCLMSSIPFHEPCCFLENDV
jgi:hypothetical protein